MSTIAYANFGMFSAGIEPAGMIVHNIEQLKRAKQNNFIMNLEFKNC